MAEEKNQIELDLDDSQETEVDVSDEKTEGEAPLAAEAILMIILTKRKTLRKSALTV